MAGYTPYQALQNQVGWTLGSLAILVVALRVYCRSMAQRNFGLDDGFMVMALGAGLAMMTLISAAVSHGYGLHLREITNPQDREITLMLTYLAPAVSVLASTLGKISMVIFLVRLLGSSTKRGHLWLLYGVTMIMISVNIFIIGVFLGQCTPMQKSWRPEVPGTCVSHAVWDYGGRIQAGWNAFMDLLTAGFPIYMVWTLQMRKSTKWGLSALMAGGVCAAAATFAKIWFMAGHMTNLDDVTYAWAPLSLCYVTEVFLLIIGGTLPTLRPIAGCCSDPRYKQRLFAQRAEKTGSVSRPSRYEGTTMAGTTGWTLPDIELTARDQRDESLGDFTALPQIQSTPSTPETTTVPQNHPALSTDPAHRLQTRNSLGAITVQQDFSLAYERSPRDSMDLESGRRP